MEKYAHICDLFKIETFVIYVNAFVFVNESNWGKNNKIMATNCRFANE